MAVACDGLVLLYIITILEEYPLCELLSYHFYLLLFLRPLFDIFHLFSLLKYHLLYFLNFIVLCPAIKENFPPIGELLSSHFYLFLLLRPL